MVKKVIEEKKKSSFRNKKERDVIYPLLQECVAIEKEKTWQELFNNMSRGICPKCIMIQNGVIIGSISKKNTVKYNFIEETPQQIIDNVKNLFSNLINIQSDNNKRNKELDNINDQYNDFVNMEWRSIKKKAIKDLLIQNYILDLKNKYNLRFSFARIGLEVVTNALYIYKTHDSSDVEYSNGKITNINDIVIENEIIINKRINKIENVKEDFEADEETEKIIASKISLKELWDSYLKSVAKS